MAKSKEKNLAIFLIAITIFISAIIISLGFVFKNQNESGGQWQLKAYGNSIALYNGTEMVEVYGAVSVEDLPESDKKLLRGGILFATKEEARMAIEDYDG